MPSPRTTGIFLTISTKLFNPTSSNEAAWSEPYEDLSFVICLSIAVAPKQAAIKEGDTDGS